MTFKPIPVPREPLKPIPDAVVEGLGEAYRKIIQKAARDAIEAFDTPNYTQAKVQVDKELKCPPKQT